VYLAKKYELPFSL